MAGLDARLTALTFPAGTEFPGTIQALLNLLVQYCQITGLETFNGINYGDTTPAEADRDKPWFKTDESDNPLGWFGWNGSAWTPIPFVAPSGTTANRPASAVVGQEYFDTTITALLVYDGSAWVTAAGSPGDLKFVTAATSEAALAANPGWAIYEAGAGRVLGVAGAGSGLTERAQGATVGAETHTLIEGELPPHHHDDIVLEGSNEDFGDPGTLVLTAKTQDNGLRTILNSTTGDTGDGDAHENMQPTLFLYCLVKS